MTAHEFWARINPDHTLTVPPEVAAQLQEKEMLRVVVIVSGQDEDEPWTDLTTEQFLRGYAPGDVIYDDLPAG